MHRRPASRASLSVGGKIFLCVLLTLVGIVVVGAAMISVMDIAGDTVAGMASNAVKEQAGLLLSVEKVSGNPVRGYTFENVALAAPGAGTAEPRPILSAGNLQAKVNFMSLLRGAPRLALLAVGGVDMDLDRFIEEISRIKFPESSQEETDIPIDRVSLRDSRFTSKWGVVEVSDVAASIEGQTLDVSVDGAVNAVPVSGAADVRLQKETIGIDKADLHVGKGLVTLAGGVGLTPGADGGTPVNLQGSVKGLDVSEAAAFWPAYLASEDYAGAADLTFKLDGAGSDLVISAELGFNGSKLGGYPMEKLSAQLKYAGLRLTVSGIKATALGVPIEGEIAAAMRAGAVPSVMVKLEARDAPLSELAKLYPALGSAGGKVDRFSANIQGPTNALSGTIELAAPSVVLMGKKIDNLALQVKLAKSDSASVSGKFVLEGAQSFVQGSLASILSGANLNLTANVQKLNVKRIEDLIPDGKTYGLSGEVNADLAVKGKLSALSVSGKLSSPKFSASGYTLDKPSVSFAYDKDTFTLRESGGSWSGLPIKASGKVGPLTSKTPSIDMTAQLAFKPENLKQFVPDIGTYKLQGTINAGVKITGRLPQPKVELVASSPALSALGSVSAKNLEVTTALAGDLTKLDKLDLTLKTASVAAGGVGLQNLSAVIRKNGQQIRLENVSAASGGGSLAGGGTIAMNANDAALDLSFDMQRLDLAPLAKSGGLGVALAGVLSGKASVKGPSSNPEISFTGSAPSVAVEGITLTDLAADVSGNMKTLKINSFKANVGGAPLSAAGGVSITPFRADIDVSGAGLDLAALTAGVPDLKGQISGKADLKFSVKSTASGSSGTGSVTSAAVTAFGIKTSGVTVPLSLSGNVLKSEGAALQLYGGKLTNNLTFDIGSMKFSDSVNASGVDVNALAQDASGGFNGKINGRGSLTMKIDGSAANAVTYSGTGQFSMGEGSITGFSGLDILTRLYGVNGIRYTKVTAPLRLQAGKLVIGKGTSAVPPANDPIYKSAALAEDGSVTFDKKLYFVADANVNFQLVNALTGGAAGGAEALLKGGGLHDIFSGKNLESALRGAINVGSEQGKEADFRSVTVKVTGTADKPAVSLVKVGPRQGQSAESGQTQPAQSPAEAPTQSAAPAAPKKPEDIIKDKILEQIIPPKRQEAQPQATPPQATQPQATQPQQAQPQEQQTPQQQIEQKIEEKVEDEIRKGLNNLFKRR